jgi:DNA phosphorothioation system restriction enzyme
MDFKALTLPFQVTTTRDDPIEVLFNPLLRHAVRYDVAVGYFSSNWIRDAASGIAALASNGGVARWVISPSLSREDWDLLSTARSNEARQEIIETAARYEYAALQRALADDTRVALAWLIRDRVLNFRIAVPKNALSGIFHAKMGVFRDADGNQVAFSGSYNLTGAAGTNWETIDVYASWLPGDDKRVQAKVADFERIWQAEDANLDIFQPTDDLVAKFVEITQHAPRPYRLAKPETVTRRAALTIPGHYLNDQGKLRAHQEQAIQNWFKHNGRGIFQMATGAGKTVTALTTVLKLAQFCERSKKRLVTIVAVPYKHLAEQWCEEARAFGFDPLICYEQFESWAPQFQQRLRDLSLGASEHELVITVNATFTGERFQALLQDVDVTFLFIADEMHNMGGEKIRTVLPAHAQFRLGLSATPERHNDEIGTRAIQDYFGPVVIEYGLDEAIADGTLTPYMYHPIPVEFTPDEMDRYRELSSKIARLFAQGGGDTEEPSNALKMALLERARMIGDAENKIGILKSLLAARRDSQYNLVYCGDGIADGERSIERVLAMLGTELGMRVNKFTHEESNEQRRAMLDDFSAGRLQAIAAIRCLDEGVDIPRTETAYILASTSNPRQYIQRRGRVLRLAPGKRYAAIYDFIVVPPDGTTLDDGAFNVERRLVRKELERVDEFASSSQNAGEALRALRDIKQRLRLLDC